MMVAFIYLYIITNNFPPESKTNTVYKATACYSLRLCAKELHYRPIPIKNT